MASTELQTHSDTAYALGYTDGEHERLMRQAALIAPITEHFFRKAGIGPGQRVLDLGSGLGDVSMILAKLVGPSGEVVGIDRDAASVSKANLRVADAGFRNVCFLETDVKNVPGTKPFDAAVGRFILMFLPDPLSVLRSVAQLVRPGGVLAFQEPTWIPMLAMAKHLPMWSRVLDTIHETFLRSGVNSEMGIDLHCMFQQVGLPAPSMHTDMLLGTDMNLISILSDLLKSIRPLAERHSVRLDELGELAQLSERIHKEISGANSVVGFVPMVSAWSRKPGE
jgi:SAM-dependent methyltransferase